MKINPKAVQIAAHIVQSMTESRPSVCYDCQEEDVSTQDMRMGQAWRENSSLEKWFPFTAQELKERQEAMCEIVRILGHGCTGLSHQEIVEHVRQLKIYVDVNSKVLAGRCQKCGGQPANK